MAALGTPMIWDEDPIDSEHRERTYALSFEGPEGFERVLVRAANSLGFCVYDYVAAHLYLPFSRLLTFEGRKRVQWVDHTHVAVSPDDREAVMARCEAAWRPRFEAHGFTFRRDEPFRDEQGCETCHKRHGVVGTLALKEPAAPLAAARIS